MALPGDPSLGDGLLGALVGSWVGGAGAPASAPGAGGPGSRRSLRCRLVASMAFTGGERLGAFARVLAREGLSGAPPLPAPREATDPSSFSLGASAVTGDGSSPPFARPGGDSDGVMQTSYRARSVDMKRSTAAIISTSDSRPSLSGMCTCEKSVAKSSKVRDSRCSTSSTVASRVTLASLIAGAALLSAATAPDSPGGACASSSPPGVSLGATLGSADARCNGAGFSRGGSSRRRKPRSAK